MRGDPGRERVPCRGEGVVTGGRARGIPRTTGVVVVVVVMMIVVCGCVGGGRWIEEKQLGEREPRTIHRCYHLLLFAFFFLSLFFLLPLVVLRLRLLLLPLDAAMGERACLWRANNVEKLLLLLLFLRS